MNEEASMKIGCEGRDCVPVSGCADEAGFTLVETLIAIVILVFGLIAVTNLFLVAGTSNQAASHATAAVTQATETLEALKAIKFTDLYAAVGASGTAGDLDADAGAGGTCMPNCVGSPDLCPTQCVVAGNYNYYREVPGVGMIRTRWQIVNPGAAGPDALFITVRSESLAPLVGGARSKAEFSTFRTCTSQGCP